MKIALIHDYLKEYGGAERVLRVLSDMYPNAPIYTAFRVKNSTAGREFADSDIHESWLAPLLKIGKLYSPLRFLAPLVWRSFDLSGYDVVITSASWFITRGFKVGPKTKVICYCHTPPRWLYGYETSVGFTKYWPVKVYSTIVGHFMRMYDWWSAQPPSSKTSASRRGVDMFIANSKNVQERIKKFYRRDSVVIYPPVDVEKIIKATENIHKRHAEFSSASRMILKRVQAIGSEAQVFDSEVAQTRGARRDDSAPYFLVVSRLVGAKGLEEAARAFKNLKYKLKVVGEAAGYSEVAERLKKLSGGNVELLGRLDDISLYQTYAKAKGFIALARDEDFGMTVVEAQAAGTPVIAFNGGGFNESVIDGVTGILIDDTDKKTIADALKRFNKVKWDKKKLQENALRFSRERFIKEIMSVVEHL